MQLMKIDGVLRGKIVSANMKAGNAKLIPCCYEGMEGEYIELDAVRDDPDTFVEQMKVIGIVSAEDIVKVEFSHPPGQPTRTLRITRT